MHILLDLIVYSQSLLKHKRIYKELILRSQSESLILLILQALN